MISVAIGRSMLKSYESIADREVRLERLKPSKTQESAGLFGRVRQLVSRSK